MKYSGHRKLLCELSKLSKFNAFYPSRILNEHCYIYSCLQIPPRRSGFNMYTEYTSTNFLCIKALISYNIKRVYTTLDCSCTALSTRSTHSSAVCRSGAPQYLNSSIIQNIQAPVCFPSMKYWPNFSSI